MKEKQKYPQSDRLFEAILSLKSKEECKAFFNDLCTITELNSMVCRMEVAYMLSKGCVYNDVVKATGASSATISRVSRCLNYGEDGYKMVLDRIKSED